ncbi:recombinase family protein [Metabacillus litoralis]|uniref:recombinase family protein n=1 Tax=Metabacillus litoralis TaxID=152268 RepID=UPI001CFD26B5|nr:recombinase family protein [Metabacillus litoralis]
MKCAVYIRVSTDKEEQKTSLENQQRFFYNVIADKGWDLFRFYIDVESGTKDKKRENLRQLIEDAKEQKFDVILSKELSRLARNGKLSYEIKDIAEKHNIHIITFDNAINSLEGNIHMFGLYAWVYEQESQRTSERIKAALTTNAKRGDFQGSNAPYGYKLVDKKLFLAEDNTPDITKSIFELYISGLGFDSIARHLSDKGYPTPAKVAGKSNAGRFWHGSTIKKILSNPHYTGDLVQGRETTRSVTSQSRHNQPIEKHIIVRNTHSAIISHDVFDAVQKLMNTRKKNFTKVKRHLFTNVLFCLDCGTGMWYRQNRCGYICGRYARHGKSACTQRNVKEKYIEEHILNDIKEAASKVNQEQLLEKMESSIAKKNHQVSITIKQLDSKISDIESKKKRYLEMLAENLITHKEYRDAANDSDEQIKILKIKRSELQASLQFKNLAEDVQLLKTTLNRFLLKEEVTEEMVHHLVERIDVDKYGTPKITYHFSLMNNS